MPTTNEAHIVSEPDPEPQLCGWLMLDVVDVAGDWAAVMDARAAIAAAATALAGHQYFMARGPASVCVALSDDASVRQLNLTYREKDQPTNVLSFEAGDDAQEPGSEAVFLGDVVLALETVMAEAQALGIPVLHHLQHLAVHGILHLEGFDHQTGDEAERMEALEREILASLGIADPYANGVLLEPVAGE